MIVYHSQPNRVFPCLYSFKKNNQHPVAYEFNTPLCLYTKKDNDFLYEKKILKYTYNQKIPRHIKDKYFHPLFLRLKKQQQLSPEKEFDFIQGLFPKKYYEKKEGDFVFTFIDHPINQILNMFVYIKYNINSKYEIEKFDKVLRFNEAEYENFMGKNGFDLPLDYSNFKRGDDLFCYDYVYSMDLFLKENTMKQFVEYQNGYFVFMLICSCSLKNINSMEEWIDYFIENPYLTNTVTFRDIKMTFYSDFFRCSEIGNHIDFYGVMDDQKDLNFSIKKLNDVCPEMWFKLKDSYNQYNHLNWSYRRKELDKLFEKDIDFFYKKKELL